MRHIKKLACGRRDYRCVGIWSSDSSLSAIVLKIKLLIPVISTHSVNYDAVSVPTYGSSVDNIANNFNNIPRFILGIVNQVLYTDLQLLGGLINSVVGRCRDVFNPLLSSLGLLDFFGKITLISGAFSPYKFLLALYTSDAKLLPGIILPIASLSNFNPTPVAVIPSSFASVMNMARTIINYGVGGALASDITLGLTSALGQSPCPVGTRIDVVFGSKRYKNLPFIAQGSGLVRVDITVPAYQSIVLGTLQISLNQGLVFLTSLNVFFGLRATIILVARLVKDAVFPHTYINLDIISYSYEPPQNDSAYKYVTLAIITVVPYSDYLMLRVDQPLCGNYNIQDELLSIARPTNGNPSVLIYDPVSSQSYGGGYNWVQTVAIT